MYRLHSTRYPTFWLLALLLALVASSCQPPAPRVPDGRAEPQVVSPAALGQWLSLAEQGDAEAQYTLGGMYYKGEGTPQDMEQAAQWYRRAAEQGHPLAQNNLGGLYATGQGVPHDNRQAYLWFNLAATLQASSPHRATAVHNRDVVAAHLTAPQLLEAQRLARE